MARIGIAKHIKKHLTECFSECYAMRAYPVRTNDLTKTLVKIARPTVENPHSLNEAWRFGP